MSTILPSKSFYRLKAAIRDIIDRAGGIDRAAQITGYSRSAVGRWHCRNDQDLMPLAAAVALEADTGAALVTRALMALAGVDGGPSPVDEGSHILGAYVSLTASSAALNSEVASAVADGVLTPAEQVRIDERASDLDKHNEALRGSLAGAAGKTMKVVG